MTTEVRPYEAPDRPELFRLMREVWGSYLSEEEFSWWFDRNPAGEPLIRLAEDDGRVVAVACMSPYRLLLNGSVQLAYVPLHVATLPAYRGRGLFARLEQENERAAAQRTAVAITFPNAASRRVFTARLGWRDLPRPRVWARPAAGRARAVERVERFPAETGELARTLGGNGVLRDADYLNWRFADSPRAYTCLAGRDGFAVVGSRRGLSYVAELVAEPGPPTRRLLSACASVATGPALLAPGAGPGFVPTPKRILVMGKELRPDGRLPERWRFSLGDGDSW